MEEHVVATIAVVVPTTNRHDALGRLIDALANQSHPPDVVMIVAPASETIPEPILALPWVTVVWVDSSDLGASRQRNIGIAALDPGTDHVILLDDDTVPRSDYIANAVRRLEGDPAVVAVTGGPSVRDGAKEHRELTEEEIHRALEESWRRPAAAERDVRTVYGGVCARYRPLAAELLDERLPLYSWLEDLDLARRLTRHGRIVLLESCVTVHQASMSGGREQHRRFGYSCVANPWYLRAKGTVGSDEAAVLILRPLAANVIGLLNPRQSEWRRQRLGGMALAFSDVVRGRADPERARLL